jgi:hypothetical protein
MPRTASNSQTRKSIHSRLRPQSAPSERDKTPVLLRLPRIEIAEDSPVFSEDVAPEEDANAVASPEALNYAIPDEIADSPEYGDLPGIPQHETPTPETRSDEAGEELDSTDSSAEAVNAGAAGFETQSIIASAPAHSVETTQVDATAHVQTDAEQSWWEHWSSGVVLIILIIALVTASILAFNDTPDGDPNLLAEQASSVTTDLGSPNLDEISIPELVDSSAAEAVTGQEAVSIPGLSADAVHSVQVSEPAETPTIEAQLVGSISPSEGDSPTSSEPESTSSETESLLLGSADGLEFTNEPLTPELTIGSPNEADAETAQVPSESNLELSPPTLTPPSLDKTASVPELPSLGGDLSTPEVEPPSMLFGEEFVDQTTPDRETLAPPLPTLPTFQVSTDDSAPSFNQASHIASKPAETAAPEQPNEITPDTQAANSAKSASPIANSGSENYRTQNPASPTSTLTPDSDAEAIMQAYREFKQITYGSNLYPDSN